MGWLRGFEPPASWTTTRRSNQLSYSHHHLRAAIAGNTRWRICVDLKHRSGQAPCSIRLGPRKYRLFAVSVIALPGTRVLESDVSF